MRAAKLYEHPEFTMEEADLSLFSTICLVLILVMIGALFVSMLSCILFWNDCSLSYASYQPAHMFWAAQQTVLRG